MMSEKLHQLLGELQHGLRRLSRAPGLFAAAVCTLALGISATTILYSVVRHVLWSPLPVGDSERLAMVWMSNQEWGKEKGGFSPLNFQDTRARVESFQEMASAQEFGTTLLGEGDPEEVLGFAVSGNFFQTLGSQPFLGRGFLPHEDLPEAEGTVVLSYGLWAERFGKDPGVLGKAISFNHVPTTVVGVMPKDFRFPKLSVFNFEPRFFTPSRLQAEGYHRGSRSLAAIARLKPGVSLATARAEVAKVGDQLAAEYPDPNRGWKMWLNPIKEEVVGAVRPALSLLAGAVLVFLLIAVGNVANLLLVRAVAREEEITMRSALGASWRQILRLLLVEGLLLAAFGGALGVVLATWGLRLVTRYGPADFPRLGEAALDGEVLLFALLLTLLTGTLSGLAPALHLARGQRTGALRTSNADSHGSRWGKRVRRGLTVAQVALALALLIGASLLLTSLGRMMRVDPGFAPDHLLTVDLSLPQPRYTLTPMTAFYDSLLTQARSLPGVESAALVMSLPIQPRVTSTTGFTIEDRPVAAEGGDAKADFIPVSPGFFETLGTPVVTGRSFAAEDNSLRSPAVAIVNETFVRRFLRGDDPLGKYLRHGIQTMAGVPTRRRIVGVVKDIKQQGLAEEVRPALYVPAQQAPSFVMSLVLRTTQDPLTLAVPLREVISRLDSELPVKKLTTMRAILDSSLAQARFYAAAAALFAAASFLLAIVGLYGIVSTAVGQRTREIGLRCAMGAQQGNVVAMIVWEGMRLTLAGLGFGLLLAVLLGQTMKTLLFRVGAFSPAHYLLLSLAFVAAALLASYLPARRAAQIEPSVALRYE